MDRRTFIASSGAAALAATLPATALAQRRAGSGDAPLNALFERIHQQNVQRSPELATSLGLDKDTNAGLKSRLSPRTLAERARVLTQNKEALASLAAVDRRTLSPAAKLNLEVVTYSLTNQIVAPQRFGLDSAIRPYRIPRRLAAGHLLHQPQGYRRLAEIFIARSDLSRGQSRPSPPDQPRPGIEGHSDPEEGGRLQRL